MRHRGVIAITLVACVSMLGRAQSSLPDRAEPWTVASDTTVRQLLAERVGPNGVGAVVGVLEPGGARIITYGRSGAPDSRPLDGNTVFQIGSHEGVHGTAAGRHGRARRSRPGGPGRALSARRRISERASRPDMIAIASRSIRGNSSPCPHRDRCARHRFYDNTSDAEISFVGGVDGRVTGLELRAGGSRRTGTRDGARPR